MKKIVLSLAVLASVALVSCNKGAANNESESAAVAETEVAAAESETAAPAAVEAPAADSAAPAADSAK